MTKNFAAIVDVDKISGKLVKVLVNANFAGLH